MLELRWASSYDLQSHTHQAKPQCYIQFYEPVSHLVIETVVACKTGQYLSLGCRLVI